jgi:Ribbon-helix-helix protein, copG family
LRCDDRAPESIANSATAAYVIIKSIGDNMIRTQISLDEREYALAKKQAAKLGISVAELLRRALREVLPPKGDAPWMRYAGFVESGNPRSSQTIDEIVYGRKE